MGSVSNLVFTILGIDKGSEPLDKVGDAADKTASRLDRLGSTGLKALPAMAGAAVSSGAVVGNALVGVTMLMGGLGIAAASSSEVVQDEYKALADTVVAEVQGMAAPMVPALTAIAEKTTATFRTLRPQIADMIEDSAGHVETLADGVMGFSLQAMPGMVTAVDRAGPTMEGFKRLMISAGQGVGEFFGELSEGSDEAGASLADVGVMIHQVLGFAGRWFAMLATEGAPTVDAVSMVLGKLLGVVEDLSSGGFPVLFTTAGAALDIFDGLLTIVGPLATELGTVAGVVLSVAAALRVMRAVGNWGGGVAEQFSTIRKSADDAGERTSNTKARLAGMASLVGGPWGFAVAAGGALLALFGERQQESENRTRSMTDALRESKGAIDDTVRAQAAKNLAEENAFEHASKLGISQKVLVDAYLGNATAINVVNAAIERNKALVEGEGQLEGQVAGQNAMADAASELGFILDGQSSEFQEAKRNAEDYAAAMGETTAQTTAATTATQRQKQALAEKRLEVLASINAEFALEAALRGIESAQFAVTDATETYNEAVKEHGARSREAAEADLRRDEAVGQLNDSVMQALGAAGQYAIETSRVTDEAEKNQVSTEAMNRKAIEMAATWRGPLPEALTKTIGFMTAAEIAAMGVTFHVNKTGQAVYSLPDGKTIKLDAKDSALAKVRTLSEELAAVERHIQINISINQSGRIPAIVGRPTMRARGGPVKAQELYQVGEEGPELFVPTQDGFIVPADRTRQLLDNRSDGARVSASVPTAGSTGGVHVDTLVVQPLTGRFSMDEVARELYFLGMR